MEIYDIGAEKGIRTPFKLLGSDYEKFVICGGVFWIFARLEPKRGFGPLTC